MKKLLKKMAFFFLLLLLILILMNYWMDYESYPHYPLQYDEVFHPKVNADMVILEPPRQRMASIQNISKRSI